MKLKILTKKDIQNAVTMAQAIHAVRQAYIQLSRGKAVVPLRTQVPVEDRKGIVLFMPAFLPQSKSMGAKIVSVFPQNLQLGLDTIHAVVVLLDAETGCPSALLDGTYLTALRTGAASGLATDLLARQDSKVAAIFGAGVQGRTQLEAVCTVRDITKAYIYDPNPDAAKAYATEMRQWGDPIPKDISVAQTPSEALEEADIVCTATTSMEPVFEDQDLCPGVHINGIGSYTPEMQEVPGQTVVRSKLVVDSLSASLAEAGDLIIPLQNKILEESDIHGEIGQVAVDDIPGRESDSEMTFFKSVGLAVQDVATATLALQRSKELNLGISIDL
jgi:ornithine cyclodeaminase